MTQQDHCTKVLHHLNRIQGQIESLKRAIETGDNCKKVAPLTLSILRSFGTARASIVEGFILQEVVTEKKISAKNAKALTDILSLYKS